MEADKNIDYQVEKTMQALDGMERATTDDFFFARLVTQMGEQAPHSRRPAPAVVTAAAAIGLLILFNILTALHYNQQYGDSENLRQQSLEALAEEYYLEIPLLYELENGE